MPDRWTDWCRRQVPPEEREALFDPSLADLQLDWAARAGGGPSWLVRTAATLRLAWQCRQVARRGRPVGRSVPRRVSRPPIAIAHVRVALRRLIRQPVFSITAVLTLALGIGANLAVAAFVQSFLLSPIDAPEPDRLFRVVQQTPAGETTEILSWLNYVDARDGAAGVDLAAHGPATALVGPPGEAEERTVELVSGNYFRVLGQVPLAGRLIDERDNVTELSSPVAVLSEAYWRTRFGSDPAVVGRPLLVNGSPLEIVGIAREGFRGTFFAHPIDFWTPVMMQQQVRPRGLTLERRTWGWLRLIGRLSSDTSLEAAQAQLDAVAADVNRRFPPRLDADSFGLSATPAAALSDSDRGLLGPVLATSLAFTILLFVVTCANLAGVMQARMLARRRELAIRQSLGAGRSRVLVEWMAECLLLALAGGALGLVTARGVVGWIGTLRPPEQLVGSLSLAAVADWRLGAYALGLSVLAAGIFGLLPAWRAGRNVPMTTLRDEGITSTGSRAAVRVRRALVVVQLALSGVLLVAAGLLGRSLAHEQAFSPGFETGHLGLLAFDLERQRVPNADRRHLADDVLEQIRRDPEVREAELGFRTPLGFGDDVMGFRLAGHTPSDGRDYFTFDFNLVGRRYFAALGVSFVRGGPWPAILAPDGPPQVVINETMARRFWGDRNPVGDTIEIVGGPHAAIAGVVEDISYYAVGERAIPYVYLPAEVRMPAQFVVHVRTTGDPAPVIGRLARSIGAVDGRLAAFDVMTFEELRRAPLFPARLLVVTAAVFSTLALVLAGTGLYGVVAMSVGQRTREIGVRIALGARPESVLRAVLGEAVALAAAGIALAMAGGYAAAGALGAWLFQVSRFDPAAYGAVAVLLTGLAVAAAWLPARRAARVDPVVALRQS